MQRELVLDGTGAPMVMAARDDEGQLGFYVLQRYAGGRLVLEAVNEEILRSLPRSAEGGVSLAERVRYAAQAHAATVMSGDADRQRRLTDALATVEDMGAELEAARAEAAELRARIESLESAGAPPTEPVVAARRRRAAA